MRICKIANCGLEFVGKLYMYCLLCKVIFVDSRLRSKKIIDLKEVSKVLAAI